MSVIRQNIIANFTGKAWTALMSLAFIPLYIKFIGIEAYGLMGIWGALGALFTLLDMGLSTTINRELAKKSLPIYRPAGANNPSFNSIGPIRLPPVFQCQF